jgi:radical SAM-linked protein
VVQQNIKEACALKNVRVWFKKQDECIYISHLDLNRCVLRALHKSQLPIWHTEGFNPHPFATFALPLSLGFVGERESMDIRLLDEEYPLANIVTELNKCLPKGIKVYDAT